MGTTTFNASGVHTGYNYYEYFSYDIGIYHYNSSQQSVSGTYTIDANGRGMITVGSSPLAFWMISPDEIVVMTPRAPSTVCPGWSCT